MAQSLTNFEQALKEVYGPGLREAVNNSNVILSEVKRNTQDFQGKQAVWAVHLGRSSATGGRAELGTLPTAGQQSYEDARETTKYIYHTIKISGQVQAASRTDAGAFLRAMDAEMKGAEKDLKNDLSRQVFGGYEVVTATPTVGRTGGIVRLDATGSGNVLTLDVATVTRAQVRMLFVGMIIDVIDELTAGTPIISARTITAIDSSAFPTVTVTFSGAASATSAGDYIVRTSSWNAEINGLRGLINDNAGDEVDGTNAVVVHNISSASQPLWASAKVGSSTTTISEFLLDSAFDAIETDGDGGSPTLIVGSFEQRAKLANQLQLQKRYEGREMTLTAGWRGLSVARGTYVADRYCHETDAFLINTQELAWFVLEDINWDDDDGSVLFKALDGSDAVEARIKAYVQLVALNRNSHCRIQMAMPT